MEVATTSNPLLRFPPEITDMILSNLTGTELLKASEVSTGFHDFIAQSKNCMKEVKVRLADKKFSVEAKDLLKASTREYENFEISNHSCLVKSAQEILSVPGRKWLNVAISNIDFATVGEALNFFASFQFTVEELRMDRVYVKNHHFDSYQPSDLLFSSLKILEAKCCQCLLFENAFVRCKNLTHFSVKSGSGISTLALNGIKTILTSNDKLKVLQIHFNVFNLIFMEKIASSVHFKLREFHADALYRALGQQKVIEENFLQFLISQSGTLEAVTIGAWMGDQVIKVVIGEMPRLKSLFLKTFGCTPFVSMHSIAQLRNFSVTSLNFQDDLNNIDLLRSFLTAFPNLKYLKIKILDRANAQLITSLCRPLEQLEAEYLCSQSVLDQNLREHVKEFIFKKCLGLSE